MERVAFPRLPLGALLLFVIAPLRMHSGAEAVAASPFDCMAPIASLQDSWSVRTITLAEEGGTGMVVLGAGLLAGTEPMRQQAGRTALRLLARNSDGSWRIVEETSFAGQGYGPTVFDADGDGREDVVVFASEGIGTALSRLLCFRQDPRGRLLPPAAIDLPDSIIAYHVSGADADGRMSVLGRGVFTNCIWASLIEWSADGALSFLWQRRYCRPDLGNLSIDTWLPWRDFGVALVSEEVWDESPRRYTLRLEDGAWIESSSPWGHVRAFASDRRKAIRRWMWARADSIYRLAPDDEGKIVPRAIPIEGVPSGWRGGVRGTWSDVQVAGDPPRLAMAGTLDDDPEIGFVELTDDESARWVDRWPHAPAVTYAVKMSGMISRADGILATIHDVSGAICEFSGPGTPIPVGFPISVRDPVYHDLTGDGIPDLFGTAKMERKSGPRVWRWVFARGIPEPPWILPPVPVSLLLAGELETEVGDLDGDRTPDLLCIFGDSARVAIPLSFDGETLKPWDGGSVPIEGRGVLVGDFDGDRRDEALTGAGWEITEHHLISWGADRRVAASVPLAGRTFNTMGSGDFDGDGRDEILGWHYADLVVERCDRDRGEVSVIWRTASGLGSLWDASIGNIDPSPQVELVWSDGVQTQVWSCDGPGSRPSAHQIDGLLRVKPDGYAGMADLNADGSPELLSSSDGVLTILWEPLGAAREEVAIFPDMLGSAQAARPAFGDVDGDGDPDLVVFRDDGIRVERNLTIEESRVTGRDGDLQLRMIGPNPAHDRIGAILRCRFGPHPASSTVMLLDVAGRRLWQDDRVIGPHSWIPAEVPADRVRELASGVYWLHATAALPDGSRETRALRVVFVR